MTPEEEAKAKADAEEAKKVENQKLFDHAFGAGAAKARKELAESLGVTNLDEAKALIEANKKAAKEKAEADGQFKQLLEDERKKSEKLASDLAAMNSQMQKTILRSAFIAEAAGSVVDANAAFTLAEPLLTKAKVEGDTVSGMKEVVEELKKDKPYLFGTAKAGAKGSSTLPGGNGNNLPPSPKTMSGEEFAAFQKRVLAGEKIEVAQT